MHLRTLKLYYLSTHKLKEIEKGGQKLGHLHYTIGLALMNGANHQWRILPSSSLLDRGNFSWTELFAERSSSPSLEALSIKLPL
jgi:hypothetical protein